MTASSRALCMGADHQRGSGGQAGGPPPGQGWKGHSPLVGGSLARCLLRGSAPARAAAATRSAPHPPGAGSRRHAPSVTTPARASRAVLRVQGTLDLAITHKRVGANEEQG